ncbi:MAG: DUF1816 domain-containing protein [Snowella sp.]|nr:DUF1816 domain-containing protein [Snowella sp.]
MKETLLQLLNLLGFAFWVEIGTAIPRCTYYFGPFLSKAEAEGAKDGYLEDLLGEGAQGVQVEIKRCKPKNLTIFDESLEPSILKKMIFSES